MTSRISTEPQGQPDRTRPLPGTMLLAIHDFAARSGDELTLSKGDGIELVERDDDFGDGWYLGRHVASGVTGLFPEVYTRIAPRTGPPSTAVSRSYHTRIPSSGDSTNASFENKLMQQSTQTNSKAFEINGSTATQESEDKTPQASRHTSASGPLEVANNTAPLSMPNILEDKDRTVTMPSSATLPALPKNVAMTAAMTSRGQESPVMNETLSVIDEHITDMNAPHHNTAEEKRVTNDSGSEYSSHLGSRTSYINGEETDEEEEGPFTREEVLAWTPDLVAEYLFTRGVEQKHCGVLRDEDFTGDVLLGMNQDSVFLPSLDLGPVGRRLKTWIKIKELQDEVNGAATRRNTATYSEQGSDVGQHRSRSDTSSAGQGSAPVPRIPSVVERTGSRQNARLSQQKNARLDGAGDSPVSPKSAQDSPRPGSEKRPSAASIRELQHSRQNSSNGLTTNSLKASVTSASSNAPDTAHKKQPSFDRNWTMGSATPSRPLSSAGLASIAKTSTEYSSQSTAPSATFDVPDRGYFSGGEAEGKHRNVLRKRGSNATHSRNLSYTDEQRVRSATAHSRHSRFGSADSTRTSPPNARQHYYGVNGRRRTPSESSITPSLRPLPPPKDVSPVVTNLEDSPVQDSSSAKSPISPHNRQGQADWLLPAKSSSNTRHFGLRAISDVVTGHEKSRLITPTDVPTPPTPPKDSPMQSPSRDGSTPSGEPSLDFDSQDAKSSSTAQTPGSTRTSRKKSKKETSAYTRGLEKKTPREQMDNADYSGWMKKKSSNLMTTWKPRLFVLKGCRLSYYYSEDDDQEQGLIDISFHRVLPADTDRLTGLHATLTGATNTPTSPPGALAQTIADAQAAAEPESTLSKGAGDSMFIFKLVPPRTGLSRAVTFTKPTVHYFAVPNVQQGRLWMAALMKATIDRDETQPITTTYQQKTISLAKARAMRHRPPALMNFDDPVDNETIKTPASDKNGLNIQGIIFDTEPRGVDSAVSGISKADRVSELQKSESATGTNSFVGRDVVGSPTHMMTPQSA